MCTQLGGKSSIARIEEVLRFHQLIRCTRQSTFYKVDKSITLFRLCQVQPFQRANVKYLFRKCMASLKTIFHGLKAPSNVRPPAHAATARHLLRHRNRCATKTRHGTETGYSRRNVFMTPYLAATPAQSTLPPISQAWSPRPQTQARRGCQGPVLDDVFLAGFAVITLRFHCTISDSTSCPKNLAKRVNIDCNAISTVRDGELEATD